IVDVYAVPIGWWRGNGTVEYFRDRLGFTYHGTGDLPENFVYNTGSEVHFLRRLVSTFLSPLAAGYLFVVALLLAPYRRLALVLGAVAFAGLLFTFSRSSLLALAAGVVVLALVRRSPRPLALAVLVVAVSVGWAHLFPHVGPTGRWTAQDLVLQRQIAAKKGPTGGATSLGESSISSHLTNLREGVRAVLDHPQGYGLGNAGEVASRAGTHLYAGESNYTELGVETGLLGALLWIAWGLAVLVGLVRSRAAGAAAAFAAVLVLAVQTDVLGDPWIAYCVWALAGGLLVPTMERSWRSIPESTLATST
ncbi:MAG: O-antigen ligase family protein, partial [Gaiellaceae bacterium]